MLPLNNNIEDTQEVSKPKDNSVDFVLVNNVIHQKEFIYIYIYIYKFQYYFYSCGIIGVIVHGHVINRGYIMVGFVYDFYP